MPSPISMHIPNIGKKSNTLLATMLLSIDFLIALWFLVPLCSEEFEDFGERILISMFLQSKEYKANVPPAINQSLDASKDIRAR